MLKTEYLNYVIIWIAWIGITLIITLIHDNCSKKRFEMRERYLERFINSASGKKDVLEVLEDMEAGFIKKDPLKGIIKRGLDQSKRAKYQEDKGKNALKYIESKIYCWPVELAHYLSLINDGSPVKAVNNLLYDAKKAWEREVLKRREQAFAQLKSLVITKETLLAINFIFYLLWKNESSKFILISVNFVGLILFTAFCLDLSYKYKYRLNARKLAFLKWSTGILLLNSDNSINRSIIVSLKHAPNQLKADLKALSVAIKSKKQTIDSYNSLVANDSFKSANLIMGLMYENAQNQGQTSIDNISPAIHEYIEELDKEKVFLNYKKNKAHATVLGFTLQLAGSLGIMLNVVGLLTLVLQNQYFQ